MSAMKEELMDNYLKATPLEFACDCKGCRNYCPDIAGIVHPSQLDGRAQGYYFSRGAMSFFNSRLGAWTRLTNPALATGRDNRDGVAVVVSSAYERGGERHYEVITLCAWGAVHRGEDSDGLKNYPTSRAARKALAAATYPVGCLCHGCQLDAANGGARLR